LIRDVADMKDIKLKFLACDSLGVRSIATFVETDKKILIDPGAALGPSRYGLPPTPQELNALDNAIDKIKWYAQRSQIITISHYHYDHYIPDECIYKNKTLLIKDPKNNINKSQTKRSAEFLSFLSNECEPKKIDIADSERFKFGKTVLEFSPPMFHGGSDRLGYVLMLAVKYKKEVFVHGSDVQGPQTDDATEWIISQRPDVMVLSGFPTIFLGWKMSKKNFEKSNQNLIRFYFCIYIHQEYNGHNGNVIWLLFETFVHTTLSYQLHCPMRLIPVVWVAIHTCSGQGLPPGLSIFSCQSQQM